MKPEPPRSEIISGECDSAATYANFDLLLSGFPTKASNLHRKIFERGEKDSDDLIQRNMFEGLMSFNYHGRQPQRRLNRQ